MNNMWVQAGFVGICFGIWPLFGNLTRLKGNVAVLFYTLVSFLIILPLARKDLVVSTDARWGIALLAGSIATLGSIMFNDMISRTPTSGVSILIVITLVTNATVQGVNHVVRTGDLTVSKGAGFVLAAVAIGLLLKK